MAVITIHKCDKCGGTSEQEGFQLFELKVTSRPIYPTLVSSTKDCMPSQQWCRDCLNGSALLGITDKMLEERRVAQLAQPVPATLEDMIRGIAYEEAESAVSNSQQR